MSAAPSRLKQARTPLGGSDGHEVPSVGADVCAAPSRLKQARTPLGLSAAGCDCGPTSDGHEVPSVGVVQ